MAVQTMNFAGFESSHDYEVIVNAGDVQILTTPAPPQPNETYTMNLVGGGIDAVVQVSSTFNLTNQFVTMGMYIQIQDDTPVGDTLFLEIEGDTRINMELYYTATGKILVKDANGNLVGTSTASLVAGTWYLLEFEYKPATSGDLQIFLDGTSILTFTGEDFEKDGQVVSLIRFIGSRAGESLYIASFYVEIDGTAYPTRYGPYEILTYAYSEAVAAPNVSGPDLQGGTLWSQSAERTGNDANASKYTTAGNKGIVQTDFTGNGYTAGPNGDSRVGTILAASWLMRSALSGFGPTGNLWYGAGVAPTDGTFSAAISGTTLNLNRIFDNGTKMPTVDEYFQYGFELSSGFTLNLKEVWCSLVHQPSIGGALVHVVSSTVNVSDGKVASRDLVRESAAIVNLADGEVSARTLARVTGETVNLSDAAVPLVGLIRSSAATVNVADATVHAIASTLVQVVGSTVNLSEQASHAKQIARLSTSSVELADAIVHRGAAVHSTASTVAIADSQASGLALVRVVGDTINVSESTPWVRGLSHVADATVNLSEGTAKAIASAIVHVSDATVNVSDSTLHPVSSALLHIVNDAVDIAEAVNRRAALVRATASTVDITEAANTAIGMVRLSAATINLAEQINQHRAIVRLSAAGLNITDATVAARGLLHLVASTVNLSDAQAHLVTVGGNALKQIVADTLNLAEAVERHKAIAQAIGESVNITEGTLHAGAFVRAVSDSVNVAESVDRLGAMVRAVDATLNVTEAVQHLRGITKLFGATLNLAEQIGTRRGIVRVTGSTVTLAETVARAAALVRRLEETMTVADAQLAARALRRIASDGVNIGEGLIFSGVFPFVMVNESVAISEGVLHRLTERGHVNLEDLMAELYRTSTVESDLDVEVVMRDIFAGLKM